MRNADNGILARDRPAGVDLASSSIGGSAGVAGRLGSASAAEPSAAGCDPAS